VASVDRDWIRRLLQRWQDDEIDKEVVHEEAEALWDSFKRWPSYPRQDPRSIPLEVLSHLEILDHQLITRGDVPAILEFLDSSPGRELEGWRRWLRYWNELDMHKRVESLKDDPYYSAYPISGKPPDPPD
jgi:hypothetical protein